MVISGLQKLTLLDYPGHTACTVFTPGCNWRCPFCHNAVLVLRPDEQPVMDEAFARAAEAAADWADHGIDHAMQLGNRK